MYACIAECSACTDLEKWEVWDTAEEFVWKHMPPRVPNFHDAYDCRLVPIGYTKSSNLTKGLTYMYFIRWKVQGYKCVCVYNASPSHEH